MGKIRDITWNSTTRLQQKTLIATLVVTTLIVALMAKQLVLK